MVNNDNTSDHACDLKCPSVPGLGIFKGFCCRVCRKSRRGLLNEANAHLWTEEKGFWGPDGCTLPREQRPPECRTYDCKHRAFYVCGVQYGIVTFDGEKWKVTLESRDVLVGWVVPETADELTKEIHRRVEARNERILNHERNT